MRRASPGVSKSFLHIRVVESLREVDERKRKQRDLPELLAVYAVENRLARWLEAFPNICLLAAESLYESIYIGRRFLADGSLLYTIFHILKFSMLFIILNLNISFKKV